MQKKSINNTPSELHLTQYTKANNREQIIPYITRNKTTLTQQALDRTDRQSQNRVLYNIRTYKQYVQGMFTSSSSIRTEVAGNSEYTLTRIVPPPTLQLPLHLLHYVVGE